jgi:hypothetical protein
MRIIKQLSETDTNWLINQLENIKSNLTADISQYAKNRQRAWLNGLGEPHLSYPKISESTQNQAIDQFIWDKLGINYDFCLAHYSGDKASGIKPHRDASYANREAYGINLGICKFTIADKTYELSGGEIYTFNCKVIHSADPSPHRWGLNLWTAKPIWLSRID